MIVRFQGREAQLLTELHREYNISDNRVSSTQPEREEEEDLGARVVYSFGCVVRDIPSGAAASLGKVELGAKVTLTGRTYPSICLRCLVLCVSDA
jgi:hypothetical protein